MRFLTATRITDLSGSLLSLRVLTSGTWDPPLPRRPHNPASRSLVPQQSLDCDVSIYCIFLGGTSLTNLHRLPVHLPLDRLLQRQQSNVYRIL